MFKHTLKRTLDIGNLLVEHKLKSCNAEKVIAFYKRHALGYVEHKQNYCTSNHRLPVRDTVREVLEKQQQELDEFLKDPENQRAYEKLQHQLKLMRYEGKLVPEIIRPQDILTLLRQTSTSRRKYLITLYKREEKDRFDKEEKKRKLKEDLGPIPEDQQCYDGEQVYYGLARNTMFMRIYNKQIHTFQHSRIIQAMQFEQPLVFDMGYEQHMTHSEKLFCAKQLTLSFAANRQHKLPFYMYLCGAHENSEILKAVYRNIPVMYDKSFPWTITPKPFTEMFDKSKLVYLTPHTHNVLTKFDNDAIYIIGGIVDKGEKVPYSLAKAKKENIKMARLPLDEYLSWGIGTKTLTLDQVLNILLDVRATNNDWLTALNHVPRRKLFEFNQYRKPLVRRNKL